MHDAMGLIALVNSNASEVEMPGPLSEMMCTHGPTVNIETPEVSDHSPNMRRKKLLMSRQKRGCSGPTATGLPVTKIYVPVEIN